MATTWRPGVRATDTESLPPLPVLPQFPGMRGYAELRAALQGLGFRHAAELLREPARRRAAGGVFGTLPRPETDDGFRVLDGLWFPGRGGLWQRVDVAYVRRAREAWQASTDRRALTAAAVADTLETLARDDPMGLRRVVLWELCCLLKDRDPGDEGRTGGDAGQSSAPGGPPDPSPPTTPDDVIALGVHRSEARLLAAAVDAGFPAAGARRRAAEAINSFWPGSRLRAAELVAAPLPDDPEDHVLARLLGSLRDRSAAVARLAAQAGALEERGDWRAAATAWLGALRQAEDAPEARTGLLRAATALADAAVAPHATAVPHATAAPQGTVGPLVTATLDAPCVRLAWQPPRAPRTRPGPVTYRILRFPDGAPEQAVELATATDVLTAEDAQAPLGRALRYAVLPLVGPRVAGVPRVTGPVLIAPDATDLTAVSVPDGVRLRWRPHPAATAVRVLRSAGGAPHTVVPCERDRLLDVPLPLGTYAYEVNCGYPGGGPDGGVVWSPGVRVTARSEEWPAPVTDLTARRDGDRVHLAWRAPERGGSSVVPWPAGPVAAGSDVSAQVGSLAAAHAANGAAPLRAELLAPPGQRLRMTAVSALGDRVVAGPSVVVEHPVGVTDLRVRRAGAGLADVSFGWPEPAVLTLVVWDDGVRRGEVHVPRSRHRAAGGTVTVAVPETACTVTVTPLARPDAVAVPAAPAHAVLPPAPPPARPTAGPWPSAARWQGWQRWQRWRRRLRRRPPAPTGP
ncbi:hypothetical protein [Streptomyces sp. NPDC059063]|uniref:hypothetical protein n=1 Tax=unclassified Streptomyces TaxID=2593676 RepID=UPI00369D998B